ncbi:MAG: FkbM family methyltransferase [Rhodocyclaceae bacterium]|nr:MAG: FkbM family methyltransferase [Rhodocyclaceae bacterium]TNC98420.1 MAG: FkbM family methyltransferase [Rhodocyclaceae bacterium]
MKKPLVSMLRQASRSLDKIARLGRHRFVRDHSLGVAHGEYQLQQLFSLLDVDMVFDVGGNAGQYGTQIRQTIGYRGAMFSFEPMPHAADQIRIAARNDPAWQIRECAVDDVRGRATFNIMAGDQFSSLLAPSKEFEGRFHGQHSVQRTIDVEVITLRDAVIQAPRFARGLLKLDTQGTELRLLRGGVDSLSHFPAIQMEVGFQMLYEGEGRYTEVVDQLDEWGYRLSALFPNNQGHFPHLLEMDAVFLRKEHFPELP